MMSTVKTRARSHELTGALAGGAVASLMLFATILGVGRIGSFEALKLIEAALPTARFFAASVLGGAITVLGLLLTLVALSLQSDFDFHTRLYLRTRHLTKLSVISLVIATAVLLFVTVPVTEVEELGGHYALLYYGLAAAMAILGGLVISIALLIGATLNGLIRIGHPEGESDLLATNESRSDRERSQSEV